MLCVNSRAEKKIFLKFTDTFLGMNGESFRRIYFLDKFRAMSLYSKTFDTETGARI